MGRILRSWSVSLVCVSTTLATAWAAPCPYRWKASCAPEQALERRLSAPAGFVREALPPESFGAWLRGLPLLAGKPPVRLYDGRLKANQEAHAAVVDIDVGRRDLQQCADAVMRLRAEYLFAAGRAAEVGFRFTSGDACPFERWSRGERPVVRGDRVRWTRSREPDASHASLRHYLDTVFTYAGSASLARELAPLSPSEPVRAGDVFIQGGFPGHAVLVVDTASHPRTGERVFMLVQSYMPAQQIHVLRRPGTRDPWYPADFGESLVTPEWTFRRGDRRRFRD